MEVPAGDAERLAPALLALAEHAEAIGLDSVWVCDYSFANEAHVALGVDDVLLGGGWATGRTLDRLAERLDVRPC